ncbi:benzoate/H(+) symporter BenE family transporter [Nocardiopsis changdeensis]|uniref:Benzoate/H(+) symporter BenE family transporter n=1 Tax=Nocardiopsis changdeensis TaxID=2831969 RepID=A0ABX8BPR6_9ACTN|nr:MULTISPECIES: benzoate/H(+) symporter BenE family transporter [Nocardiopsis]QUX24069.1 benzoate/H(+) symporter BenE family transporter [Nocardiopsis changdeensis]QYX34465.1 benzoate/H(+) symporter BenE family transporter [Nocardiopsis sp. MT53]
MRTLLRFAGSVTPLPAVTAGLVAVLVGVTSSAAIVFTAAEAAGADSGQVASWMLALGVGMAVTCVGLSLRYRAPVVTAWSTPGAALLAVGLDGVTLAQAVGAFVFSAALITLSGVTGWFEKVMDRIPVPLAAGLLAGVLLQFGIGLFTSMEGDLAVVAAMFAVYLAARRWAPRYAVPAALVAGGAVAALGGTLDLSGVVPRLAVPVLVVPEFSWQVLVSVGVPLFVVTMASQNLPGVAVLRNDGYRVPVSPLIGWTGATNLVLAPFGCFGMNLAAITAAICTGPQAHPDRERRFLAGVWAGVFYLVVGVFGATVAALLVALPPALIAAIAGLGLLGTIGGSLSSALSDERSREAALVTFLATASGVTFLGIGSAFWGLVAGTVTWAVTARRGARTDEEAEAA